MCFIPAKILVITQSTISSLEKVSNVIDVGDLSVSCSNLPEYPIDISYGTGGLVNQIPIICGGKPATNQCYSLIGKKWELTSLTTKRHSASSTVVNDTLWITGGRERERRKKFHLNSSEYVYVNGTVKPGPNLPKALYHHCMVKLNITAILITGGLPASNSRDTVFYDIETGNWKNGTKLKTGRYHHACAVFNSSMHGNKTVAVVAGGVSPEMNGMTETMEVLDYSNGKDSWEKCEHIF